MGQGQSNELPTVGKVTNLKPLGDFFESKAVSIFVESPFLLSQKSKQQVGLLFFVKCVCWRKNKFIKTPKEMVETFQSMSCLLYLHQWDPVAGLSQIVQPPGL